MSGCVCVCACVFVSQRIESSKEKKTSEALREREVFFPDHRRTRSGAHGGGGSRCLPSPPSSPVLLPATPDAAAAAVAEDGVYSSLPLSLEEMISPEKDANARTL